MGPFSVFLTRGHFSGGGAFLFMPSHHSKSGPVIITRRFTPEPATPAQLKARLQHKLALIEDRIAARDTFIDNSCYFLGITPPKQTKQLTSLIQQRKDTLDALSRLGE